MDVALVWFQCKNPDCDYIPVKTKKDKIKRYWSHGHSLIESARQRLFMRYIEGSYVRRNNGDILIFECKYGSITMYNLNDDDTTNTYFNPIEDKELCNPCIQKLQNESVLFG